jgi:hypothetical protein
MLPAAAPTTRVTPIVVEVLWPSTEAYDRGDAVVEFDRPQCTIRLADVYDRVGGLLEPRLAEGR